MCQGGLLLCLLLWSPKSTVDLLICNKRSWQYYAAAIISLIPLNAKKKCFHFLRPLMMEFVRRAQRKFFHSSGVSEANLHTFLRRFSLGFPP